MPNHAAVRRLEEYFEFQRLGTNWRREILAGATTFVTMAYIIFVNPGILASTGMPAAAVTAATCLSAAVGSILMGTLARYPIALAPGMGLNAYFAYSVCQGMGIPWQTALGAVFLSGVLFLLLTATGVRQLVIRAIPHELYSAVAVGIGLFIAFIGLKNAGLVKAHPETFVTMGSFREPGTALALFGLLLTAILMVRNARGAFLAGVVITTAVGVALGVVEWKPQPYSPTELTGTLLRLDLPGVLRLGAMEIVFVFLFVDMFDNIGTLLAVGKRAGIIDSAGNIPRVDRILTADALATTAGSLFGTSTVVSYIESAAGVAAGGRSGVTAIVSGLCFLLALAVAPMAGIIPAQATAPALILVGALMLSHAAEIDWTRPATAVPAFLTLVSIPLTFSIANGLAFGFTAYTVMQAAAGKARSVNWLVWLLTALFVLRFLYLGAG
jgi:AGZA family xanthine/uracil permease-like MFS transporter